VPGLRFCGVLGVHFLKSFDYPRDRNENSCWGQFSSGYDVMAAADVGGAEGHQERLGVLQKNGSSAKLCAIKEA
jgi:hypothetical protein